MNVPSRSAGLFLLMGAALIFASCGGGSSSGGGSGIENSSQLALVDVSVAGTDQVPLNTIIRFEFSAVLDPDSVRPDTIRIRKGPGYGKQVPGYFRVDENIVEFYPRLPVKQDLSDLALEAGTPYRAVIPGFPAVAVVRSYAGESLAQDAVFDFETALTGSSSLFVDNFQDPLPPRVLFVNPPNGATDVPADSRILLTFNNRPLDPRTVTTSNIRLYMEERGGEVLNRAFPIEPTLIQSQSSVQVEIVPKFPLADVATYRIEVDRRVQDLVGNDVEPPAGESQYVSRFRIRDEPFRTSEMTLEFDAREKVEIMDATATTASWDEAEPDAVAALFTAAGGNGTAGDLTPTANRTFTPDDFTRGVSVMAVDGVEADVFNFRTIEIPQNVTVRFAQRFGGPNRPVVLLSLKNVVINGTLTVTGGTGDASPEGTNYATSALPLARGGDAGPGGGDGSDSDTTTKVNPVPRMDGEDVEYGGGGGKGGGSGSYSYSYYSSSTYYYRYYYGYASGGGGGGGSRTDGRDGEDGQYPSSGYFGLGGDGGLATHKRGYPYNLERTPNVGGGGGAAGGKGFYDYYYVGSSKSVTQYFGAAGAGGGGGGAITVQSAGDVTLGSNAAILADGGDGGGPMLYYAYAGGAGGGGAGGSVKVVATGQVHLEAGTTISVEGGTGGLYNGTYTYYRPGQGGDGGDGYIRFEAIEDENSPGKALVNGVANSNLSYGPPSVGTFAPVGGGAPSIAQTEWLNLGVVDPVLYRPDATDVVSTLYNDSMAIEVQMALEDESNLGNPLLSPGTLLDFTDQDGDGEFDDTLDPTRLSEWTPISQIESLNDKHFQFIRVRVSFQLDAAHTAADPLPFLERFTLPFGF